MPWLALHIDTTKDQEAVLSEQLEELGAVAVTLTDLSDQPLYEPAPGETPLWERIRLTGLFEADADRATLQQRLSALLSKPLPPIQFEEIAERDWQRAWMDDFKPMAFGKRLWICPTHLEPPHPEAINIMLDPGLAFGTGTHPTTAMCLRWLDAHPPRGMVVIDYGCGSGVLAIAALLLGAEEVIAVDNDPQALAATEMNARQNNVADRIAIYAPQQAPQRTVPLLLANILAGPLQALAPHFADAVTVGGTIVLSGILAHQAEVVLDAYAPYFDMKQYAQEQQWLCLAGTRKPN
jgi:ribosomal protein L11 methyltransferase